MANSSNGSRGKSHAPADSAPPPEPPPPDLDAAKHARSQQTTHLTELLRTGKIFAAEMVEAIAYGSLDTDSLHAYIDGLHEDLGSPKDPLTRILVEQVAFAHLRLARLHADAAAAKSTEAVRIYNSACSRLMAEVRRAVVTLDMLRGKTPATPKLKIAKTA